MTTPEAATASDAAGPLECWCCAGTYQETDLIRLGRHPEVGVCLACAHFLHQQARGREDARHPSPAARCRDGLRAGRQLVIARHWHQNRLIGRPLRWLGQRLP